MEITKEVIERYHSVLDRGLSHGLGNSDGQMCIEAAVCYSLGLPHGDDPGCVATSVMRFKISLNDKKWSSPQSRAEGLRKLGIAQLGSKGVVDDTEFAQKLTTKIIQILIVDLYRTAFPGKSTELVDLCEKEPNSSNCRELAANYVNDVNAANYIYADAAYAADAAAYADDTFNVAADKYKKMAAQLALEVLIELKSPGCAWL